MSEQVKKPKMNWITVLDWIVSIVLLIVGIYMVVVQWPNVSGWSWLWLVMGVVGIPLAALNPMGVTRKWLLRRFIKRQG